jgi:hypothetical protein
MPLLEIVSGYLLSIFANASYDLIKTSFKTKDEPLFQSLAIAIDTASGKFFNQYGNKFGKPEYSFLARQENWDVITKSMFLSTDDLSPGSLNPEGSDGSDSASVEAVTFFLSSLRDEISKHFELDRLVTEKRHLQVTEKILEEISDQSSTLSAIKSSVEKLYEANKDSSLAQDEKLNKKFAESEAQLLNIAQQIFNRLPTPVDSQPDDIRVDKVINEQIDQYRDLINQGKPATALMLLENLKVRQWQDLSPHCQFRVLTNISAAKLSLDQKNEGAEGLLDAELLAPTDVKALCNSTLAYILLGEPAKAMDKALQAKAPCESYINRGAEGQACNYAIWKPVGTWFKFCI